MSRARDREADKNKVFIKNVGIARRANRNRAMNIECGNLNTIDTNGTGWFLGFSDWTKSNDGQCAALRHMPKDMLAHTMTMKWTTHAKNDPNGSGKPISDGRTLSVFVSERGGFRIQFSMHPDFPQGQVEECRMQRQGDFCIWGAGLYHRWLVDEDCTILSVRWVPVK